MRRHQYKIDCSGWRSVVKLQDWLAEATRSSQDTMLTRRSACKDVSMSWGVRVNESSTAREGKRRDAWAQEREVELEKQWFLCCLLWISDAIHQRMIDWLVIYDSLVKRCISTYMHWVESPQDIYGWKSSRDMVESPQDIWLKVLKRYMVECPQEIRLKVLKKQVHFMWESSWEKIDIDRDWYVNPGGCIIIDGMDIWSIVC